MVGVVVLQAGKMLTVVCHRDTIPNDRSVVNGGRMPGKVGSISVPDAYRGREQAYIKHRLFEAYLEKLFLIVGMSAQQLGVNELCYVDCFAGPWGDESENLGTTSIAISLRVLARCRQILHERGRKLRFRALYIEKDPDAFVRLKRYLDARPNDGIGAEALQGNFVDLRPGVLEWCSGDSFAFFFIDPTAWTPISVEVLRPLLERPQSEFLITLMYDHVNRAASMQDSQVPISLLFGEVPNVEHLRGQDREKRLLEIYRGNLKKLVPTTSDWPARTAYVRVLDPVKNRPKYHLVYLTAHPRGIVEFMAISEKLNLIQKRVRAHTQQRRRIEKTRTGELFPSDEDIREEEGHASAEEVEKFWLARLFHEPRRFGWSEFADMLEETDWFPGDLQKALGKLIDAGTVRNLDAEGRRRSRFLHFDKGERLQLIGGGK